MICDNFIPASYCEKNKQKQIKIVAVTKGVGDFSTSSMSFPMLPLSWILCMASFTWE